MLQDNITKIVSSFVIQILIIFGFYVLFHGEVAPGGGFQAGAIFAAAMIFYCLIYGKDQFQQKISEPMLNIFMSLGIFIYALIGILALFYGAHYLNYSVLATDPHLGQKIGIMGIEVGVAMTVASVFTKIYIKLG